MFVWNALPAIKPLDIVRCFMTPKPKPSFLVIPISMFVGDIKKVGLLSVQPFFGFENAYDHAVRYGQHILGSSGPIL